MFLSPISSAVIISSFQQEDARENLVTSEKKVRQLEIQVKDEQLASMNSQKVCLNLVFYHSFF